jgi:tRNA(Ile)-lysidine synthase
MKQTLLSFENIVADFIKANELFDNADKVLLAVSGGADSIALLHVMRVLKKQGVIKGDLYCAHINHRLRAEQADRDEEFVIEQAAKLGLKVTTRQIDVREFARNNKMSIETAARKLRIENLLEITRQNDCSHIVTGHQKDDNSETVLHRLLRGTGFRGLAGIWPNRTFHGNIRFVRPLLCVSRDEIVKYLQQNKLQWCEDETNTDCRYTRNYIRHKLLPLLQKDFNGSLMEKLYELSDSARRFYEIICNHTDNIWPQITDCTDERIILNLNIFSGQSPPIKIELVRRCLVSIGCGEGNLTQYHYQKILQLAQENVSGKILQLPDGFVVRRQYDDLIFSAYSVGLAPLISYQPAETEPVIIEIPGRTQFGRYTIEALKYLATSFTGGNASKFIESFDQDKIKMPLSIRLRQPGDRFIPLGQKDQTKIGKFLTAQKVPHEIRQNVLVVTDAEKIIWLWPVRISEQVKFTDATNNILQLEITDSETV